MSSISVRLLNHELLVGDVIEITDSTGDLPTGKYRVYFCDENSFDAVPLGTVIDPRPHNAKVLSDHWEDVKYV